MHEYSQLLVRPLCHGPCCLLRRQDHSHSHGHSEVGDGTTTAAKRFGIDNFVYRQRRPFHPERLQDMLKVRLVQACATVRTRYQIRLRIIRKSLFFFVFWRV